MSDLLTKAIEIACKAHIGQKDKAGKPYILHPIRVMSKFNDSDNEVLMIIAVLHDVVEDSDWTLDDLKNLGFSNCILSTLDCLTRRENEPYTSYIDRILYSYYATIIKIEDLRDNINIERLNKIDDSDFDRVKKYHKVLKKLLEYVGIAKRKEDEA